MTGTLLSNTLEFIFKQIYSVQFLNVKTYEYDPNFSAKHLDQFKFWNFL